MNLKIVLVKLYIIKNVWKISEARNSSIEEENMMVIFLKLKKKIFFN